MSNFNNDTMTILNYQGSKKALLGFIYKNSIEVIDETKAILDIYSGSCSVGYAFKNGFTVYANDSEYYAYIIAKSLLNYNKCPLIHFDLIKNNYLANLKNLKEIFYDYYVAEELAIKQNDINTLIDIYDKYPTVWNNKLSLFSGKIKISDDLRRNKFRYPFMLFTTYYANSYFGIKQSFEIDSIRFGIESIDNKELKSVFLTCLFFAMKECVFSKDGHMAQPLNSRKNRSKLNKVRKKSIYKNFLKKLDDFRSETFIISKKKNKTFNLKSSEILKVDEIHKNVGFIYADPPYTDMQYSRYYHLLNMVALYDYDDISKYNGAISKGLYRKQRFQSPLSQRSNAADQINELFYTCKINKINLALSYAYPRDTENQAINRYTMDIDSIINMANTTYGKQNTNVVLQEYEHSNNRNKSNKKVNEYLIICKK